MKKLLLVALSLLTLTGCGNEEQTAYGLTGKYAGYDKVHLVHSARCYELKSAIEYYDFIKITYIDSGEEVTILSPKDEVVLVKGEHCPYGG